MAVGSAIYQKIINNITLIQKQRVECPFNFIVFMKQIKDRMSTIKAGAKSFN